MFVNAQNVKKAGFAIILATVFVFGATFEGVTSAKANPFKKVSGKTWRSTSAVAKLKNGSDKLKCRARYNVSGMNTNFNLKCSGPGYFINLVANFVVNKGRINRGSWTEYSFGKKGWVGGRASKSSASVKFGGSDLGGRMSVSLGSSRRQSINIASDDGARISIRLRR